MHNMSDVLRDTLENYGSLLREMTEMHDCLMMKLAAIHRNQLELYRRTTESANSRLIELSRDHEARMEELKIQHDREISSRQTVALKMSMFKDYDRQIREYQNKLSMAEKKISQLECRKSPAEREPSQHINGSGNGSGSLQPDPQSGDSLKRVDCTDPIESNAGSNQQTQASDPPATRRKRLKWKGEVYYLDPETGEVYEGDSSMLALGKKEDKRIVLYELFQKSSIKNDRS